MLDLFSFDLSIFTDPQIWVALATLSFLEIILGVDNLIFISILSERLPPAQRQRARLIGLYLALIMRLMLLFFIGYLLLLNDPIFTIGDIPLSWRDLIFLAGGLFLIAKATMEIVAAVEGDTGHMMTTSVAAATFGSTIAQIVLLDMVFSVDSILTAFGMTRHIPIMVIAIVIAMTVMMIAAKPLSEFVNRHLSVKILALAFLILIGVVLIADGLHLHIPRPYVYFALAFSLSVQGLTILANRRHTGNK